MTENAIVPASAFTPGVEFIGARRFDQLNDQVAKTDIYAKHRILAHARCWRAFARHETKMNLRIEKKLPRRELIKAHQFLLFPLQIGVGNSIFPQFSLVTDKV